MQPVRNQNDQEIFLWHKNGYFLYGFVMFFILAVGFLGNVLTLLVLKHHKHRRRSVTPLMINLALADILIIVIGYPIAIQANLRGELLTKSSCQWVGFINGTVGIASILTLTEMSVLSYYGLKQVNRNLRLSARQVVWLNGAPWLYGGFCMLPPLLGWNRFVLSASEVSCCPDWTGKSSWDTIYNILLVILGFFAPFTVMIICYWEIYSLVHVVSVDEEVRLRCAWRYTRLKTARITVVSIIVFVISWSPYCFISLASIFIKHRVLTHSQAEIPELLAKASVIFNPVIYTIMNNRFRATLFHILRLRRRTRKTAPERLISLAISNRRRSRHGRAYQHSRRENCAELLQLQIPLTGRRLCDLASMKTEV